MTETVACPVGYSCSKLIPVTDFLLFFGGFIAILVVALIVVTWWLGDR